MPLQTFRKPSTAKTAVGPEGKTDDASVNDASITDESTQTPGTQSSHRCARSSVYMVACGREARQGGSRGEGKAAGARSRSRCPAGRLGLVTLETAVLVSAVEVAQSSKIRACASTLARAPQFISIYIS